MASLSRRRQQYPEPSIIGIETKYREALLVSSVLVAFLFFFFFDAVLRSFLSGGCSPPRRADPTAHGVTRRIAPYLLLHL